MVKTDPAKPMEIEEVATEGRIGTFVRDRATAERMLAGALRHLNTLPEMQRDFRVHGVGISDNQLRGAVRHSKRERRHKASVGSEGFAVSRQLTFKSSGDSPKAAARKAAREFNMAQGVTPRD